MLYLGIDQHKRQLTVNLRGVVDARIAERAEADEQASLLESGPGIGHYTAVAITSHIGDIRRFKRPDSLANYFGLTPGCRNSGEATQRLGSITKQGSKIVRYLLGQTSAPQHRCRMSSGTPPRDAS
jgi:transposase